MAAKKEHSFSVPGSYEQVFGAAVQSVQRCGWRLDSYDPQTGRLRAIRGWNLITYGEKIDVAIRPGAGGCEVWIRSECRGIQMVDYGHNAGNINAFTNALMAELQRPPAVSWTQPGPPVVPAAAPAGRFCSSCGAAGQPGSRFCHVCGVPAG